MSETLERDTGVFSELLNRLYKQHLQELQAVRQENMQLRIKVQKLEAACKVAQDAEVLGIPSDVDGAGNISTLVTEDIDYLSLREPSAGSQQAWSEVKDSKPPTPQKSRGMVRKISSVVPSLEKKEEVSLFKEKAKPRSHNRVLAFVEDLIYRPWFEALFGTLILFNALVMAAEAQYSGMILGTELKHASVKDVDAAALWPGATVVFEVFGWFFGLAFLAELVLKVIGQRSRFPCFMWNWIDSFIVVLWVVSTFGASMPLDPNLIRLARLARLLRLLRLAHTIQGFDSLYLITTSIASSMSILAWTSMMFFLCQMALALFLSGTLSEFYFKEPYEQLQNMQTVYTYFGTFTRALFSMFEITLGNWPPMSRMLAENVSEWFMLFGVAHKLSLGFAFVGVVNGVFMQETFKVASTDDKVMVRAKQRMVNTHTKKMRWFFNRADTDNNHRIDLDEFKGMASDPAVSMWLASMELDEKDHDLLFSLIDDGDGELSLTELTKGVGKLKGTARSIDLMRVMRQVEEIRTMLEASGLTANQRHIS